MRTFFVSFFAFLTACGAVNTGGTGQGNGNNFTGTAVAAPGNTLGDCEKQDTSCAEGRGVCVKSSGTNVGKCIKTCTANTDCGAGLCLRSGQISMCFDRCETVRECGSGMACTSVALNDVSGTSYTGGLCFPSDPRVTQLRQSCTTNASCQMNDSTLQCNIVPGYPNSCGKSCQADSDCGTTAQGAVCSSGVCTKRCDSTVDCGAWTCGRVGICEPPAPIALSPVGGPCVSSADCAGRFSCLNQASYLGGMCSAPCTSSNDCGRELCIGSGSDGICVARCTHPGSRSNCRAGYTCRAVQGANFGYCFP